MSTSAPTPMPAVSELRAAVMSGCESAASSRTKICFISPLGYGLYRPESRRPFGGAEVQFFLLAQALSSDPAFEVTVLTTVEGRPEAGRCGGLTLVARRGRKRLDHGAGLLSSLGALPGYATAFADMLRQLRAIDADVYLHAGAGVEAGAYALICRLLRRRFLYVVASSADLCEAAGQVAGPLRRLFPLGVRLADAVICRTEEQRAWLRSRYGRLGLLIRTGHPAPETRPAGSIGAKPSVLWVGRAHPLKQPELFLDLVERLPNERCVMVIGRDAAHQELLGRVRARAARLSNLTLQEDVPWGEVGRFFDGAKLLVNTSTYEGFPNTFVQAALRGVPILSWSVDPDGVLVQQHMGRCARGSFDRLVEAAVGLCTCDAARADMSRRALAYARDHHDLARLAGQWKALFSAVAAAGAMNGEPAR